MKDKRKNWRDANDPSEPPWLWPCAIGIPALIIVILVQVFA